MATTQAKKTTTTAPRTSKPVGVAAALAAVQSAVKKLEKSERNKHGGYNYASVDDFYDMIRDMLSENGLVIVQDTTEYCFQETTSSNGKTESWVVARFTYHLIQANGERWDNVGHNVAMARSSMGPQAFGTAESYGMKNFLRTMFKIATGENIDVDAHPPGEIAPRQAANSNKSTAKSNSNGSAAPKTNGSTLSKEESAKKADALIADIKKIGTPPKVVEFARKRSGEIDNLTADHAQNVRDAANAHHAELKAMATLS